MREELKGFARRDIERVRARHRRRPGRAAAQHEATANYETLDLEPLAAKAPPVTIVAEALGVAVAEELGGSPRSVGCFMQHQISERTATLNECL